MFLTSRWIKLQLIYMFIPPIVLAPINSVFKICSNFHRMCTKIRNSRLALMYMHHTPSKGMDYQSAFSFHKIHAAFLIPLSFSLRTKPGSARVKTELYKVKEVQKKFKWVDAQLKFKIPISLPLVREERGELWTLVERQLI